MNDDDDDDDVLHMKNNFASSVTAVRMLKVDRCIHFFYILLRTAAFARVPTQLNRD